MNTVITFSKVNFLLRGWIETFAKTELRRSHCVSQSSLRFKDFCLSLLSTGITGMSHHVWLKTRRLLWFTVRYAGEVFSFVGAFVRDEVYWSNVNRAYGSLSRLSVAGFFMWVTTNILNLTVAAEVACQSPSPEALLHGHREGCSLWLWFLAQS